MLQISSKVTQELYKLNQRTLEKGEIFLLAKVIADKIPLAPEDTDNIRLYTLNYRLFVEHVINELNKYTYLDDTTTKTLYRLIDELTLWRVNVAYHPPRIIFRDIEEGVIDDLSSLPRYVDVSYMCSVADIQDRANYMYNLFSELVSEVYSNYNRKDTFND